MPVVVVGLSHRTSPVEIRERLAFAEPAIPEALGKIRTLGAAEEVVIVSTCNRVEIYAAADRDAAATIEAVKGFLFAYHQFGGALGSELYQHGEPDSLTHLFRVVSGLDSMVLGETEILGQVKKAYDVALGGQHTGRRLNKAFQRAFNVAKQIRTDTEIQRGSVSVASASVELAEKIFSSLTDRTVLIIGAGDTGEKAARALLSRGARELVVTNRSPERAQALATEFNGRWVPFDGWADEFNAVDIVISSTAAPHYVLDRRRLESLLAPRRSRPLLLIDIAVPRDIDPEVNLLDDVYLYNIDDLQAIADDGLRHRKDEIARCETIIREKVAGLLSAPTPSGPGHAKLAYGS